MSIQDLNSRLQGGLRSNRFKVNFTFPSAAGAADLGALNILAKAVDLPGTDVPQVEIKHQGQTSRIAGDRVVDGTWTATFRVPNDSRVVYSALDAWQKAASPADGKVTDPSSYKVNMSVKAIGVQDSEQSSWELKGVWCQNLGAVSFDNDSTDTIQEFQVTFSVDDVVLS